MKTSLQPVLVGIPFENGIRMMQRFQRGVTGTHAAPAEILAQAAHLNVEQRLLSLDAFQFEVTLANRDDPQVVAAHNELTRSGHAAAAAEIAEIVAGGGLPISLGGDHSLTYGLMRGVSQGLRDKRRLGLIVVDAHFDMRPPEAYVGVEGLLSSGNAFYRLLKDWEMPLLGSNVAMLGLRPSLSSIFRKMAGFAGQHQVTALTDRQVRERPLDGVIAQAVEVATRDTAGVYLSLDIDAVNQLDAPGVSAPNTGGLSRVIWLELISGLVSTIPNLVGVDIVEASSRRQRWEALWEEIPTPESVEVDVLSPTVELVAETVEEIAKLLHG